MKKRMLIAVAIMLCVNALIAIGIVLFGEFTTTTTRIFTTTWIISIYFLILLRLENLYHEGKDSRWLKRFTRRRLQVYIINWMVFFTFLAIMFLLLTWGVIRFDFIRWFFTALLLMTVANFLAYMFPDNKKVENKIIQYTRWVTIGLSFIVTGFTLHLIWATWRIEEIVARLHVAFLILLVLGSIMVPLLTKIYKDAAPIVEGEKKEESE